MVLIDEELDNLLRQTFEQWDIAERRIKKAEQVRGNEVVTSAIFELRYAGRKIVDAQKLAMATDLANNAGAREDVRRYLADAYEDCVKAKHDAIDAMLDFVTNWFAELERTIGLKSIMGYFPNYITITAKIADIQDKITESRGDRHGSRDGIYDEIENSGYDEVLTLYDQMLHSRERIESQVKRERMLKRVLVLAAIAGPVVGLLGILVTIVIAASS